MARLTSCCLPVYYESPLFVKAQCDSLFVLQRIKLLINALNTKQKTKNNKTLGKLLLSNHIVKN